MLADGWLLSCRGCLLTDLYIGWPRHVHGARVLTYSDFYCRGEAEILFGNKTVQMDQKSICSALQPSISDEAVATERSHDLKCDKGTIYIVYFHTGSYRKDG